ncbi:MAG: hypothetical protein ACK4PN_19035 [Allorhizobium sp.]
MTNKPTGKGIRLAQPVKQVVVDAGLVPQKAGRKPAAASAGADGAPAKAKVNIFTPVPPSIAATRHKMKIQAVRSAAARLDAAIEAGTLPATEAKRLVLTQMAKTLGSTEAAEKWYRSHHIAELGGRTPAQLVRAGELKTLLEHLAKEAAAKA